MSVAANSPEPDPDTEVMEALKAATNPVRWQVLQWLREPEKHFPVQPEITDPRTVGVCVSHIQARAGLAQSTVSAYMAILERAGLVRSTRVGKWTHYRRDEERIAALLGRIGQDLGPLT
ncbi:ArsR/SmtB family transcription factor [Actinokineospora globicatena]|uniref:ArsR/SmtB family transcription factor n=1 Tax=Actinokineospora globicatena TaxID=103729 RepID=UPI0020A3AE74|nr:metalloregulator ArsR/SmtB family transcription factor [Actinokineospora globicatena]MCP2305945.1 DNA-binding transcriptional regulator, ArsR family [Actinokineospora globicatena]GLW80185.1 transcriptional regulator [Actinokineospora globicatena]GLW87014.1 transcriptional regulator [Actinokineospora globicatena]